MTVSYHTLTNDITLDFESSLGELFEITVESKSIDFTNPTVAFSSIQLGYNSAGFNSGIGYTKSLSDNWAGLVFAPVAGLGHQFVFSSAQQSKGCSRLPCLSAC